jgi:hypothetical protein
MARLWDDRDMIAVPTGFQSIFGRPATGAETIFSFDAEVVDIDVQRGNERTAVLMPRGGISRSLGSLQKSLNEEKFTSQSRVYPLSIELFDISSGQLNKRTAGELPYAPLTREQRLRKLAMKAMKETVKRSVRMFEILCSQSARTGKQDAIIGTSDTNLQYDWKRNTANTITVGTKWNAATPDIVGDMDLALDQIRINGHTRGDVGVVGASGMKALIRDSEMQNLADNRRYEVLWVSSNNQVPSNLQFMLEAGFDARGKVVTYKGRTLWLFTYDEGYTNSAGTFTPYMPVGEMLIFDSKARCDRYFGPPETLPEDSAMRAFYQDRFGLSPDAMPSVPIKAAGGTIMPEMFFFDAYPSGDNTTITHRTQTAPIFGTTHVDAFALLNGLV